MYDVMLVDNEPAILHALSGSLDWQAQDCRICATACDGADAVQKIEQAAPQIVISDIRMPEMDGLELAKWIADHHPAIKVILLTGFPDFSYAQQAINYRVVDFVLKPTSEDKLIAALEAAKSRIEEELPRQTASSDTGSRLTLERNLLLQQLLFDADLSLVYTLQQTAALGLDLSSFRVIRFGVSESGREADRITFVQQAQQIWQDVLCDRALYFVPRADRFGYLILCAPAAFDVQPACQEAVRRVTERADFQMTAGISAVHHAPLEIKQAAREADSAQQFAAYSAQVPVMAFESLPALSGETAAHITDALRLVQSALDSRNLPLVDSLLDRLFLTIRQQGVPLDAVHQISSILSHYGQALLISYNLEDVLADHTHTDVDALYTETDLDRLHERLRDQLTAVLDTLGHNPTNLDSCVFDVKQYIDQNYDKELSLESLAEHVHLSASYLSKLFKRELGQNISSYIQSVRIERAKVLLRTTNQKTYEIAEAVGIYDPVYFSKLFKKVTGKKPKDFRCDPADGEIPG